MQLVRRPVSISGVYLAAGVALASAGVIAAVPVGPRLPEIRSSAVTLTAGWDDVLATAEANATDIWNHFSAAPFVALQQQAANQLGYLEALGADPTKFQHVLDQIQANATAVFGAPATADTPAVPGALFGPFLPAGGAIDTLYRSLDETVQSTGTGIFGPDLVFLTHHDLYDTLRSVLPDLLPSLGLDDSDLPIAQSLFDFAASPLSGVVIGEIGTMLSPALQLHDDITAISAALSAGTWTTAFQDLLDLPGNVTNAYLNGYGDVDLMPILDQLGITLPALSLFGQDGAIDALQVNLGGLLSAGGSLLNAVGAGVDLGDLGSFDLSGVAVGPLASMVELGQAIAEALGWDGTGAPI